MQNSMSLVLASESNLKGLKIRRSSEFSRFTYNESEVTKLNQLNGNVIQINFNIQQ